MSIIVVGRCSFTIRRGILSLKRKLWIILTSKIFSTWTGGWRLFVGVLRCQFKHPLSEDDWESELLSRSLPATEINRLLSTHFTPQCRISQPLSLSSLAWFSLSIRQHVCVEAVLKVMTRVQMKSYYRAAISTVSMNTHTHTDFSIYNQ